MQLLEKEHLLIAIILWANARIRTQIERSIMDSQYLSMYCTCVCWLLYVQLQINYKKLNTVIAKKMKVLFGSNRKQNSNTGTMQPDTTLLTLDSFPRFGMTISCTHTGWTCKWNVSTNWPSQTDREDGGHTILLISTLSNSCQKYSSSFGGRSECLLGSFWWMFRHTSKQTNTSFLSSLRTVHSSPFSWSSSSNSSGHQLGLLHKMTKCGGRSLFSCAVTYTHNIS